MKPLAGKILLIGYGNPGRLDDGLGPALAEEIEKLQLPGITVAEDYQLNVEDAESISQHDVVIFADASVTIPEPFTFYQIAPKNDISFSTHSITPECLLGLAYELFQAKTRGYILAIRGYKFNDFGQMLSSDAQMNLALAIKFLTPILKNKDFTQFTDK